MRQQPLGFRELFHHWCEAREACASYFLHADTFHEIRGRQSAARASPAARGQDVIYAGGVIAERLRAPVAEENTSRRIKSVGMTAGGAGQAQMLRREAIDKAHGSCKIWRNEHDAIFRERTPRWIRFRKARQLLCDLGNDAAGEPRRCGDEKRNRIRIVFRLRELICGDKSWIAALREDYCFGRPGEQINRAVGADQSLRSRDVAIARAKKFVHARN